MINPNLAVNLSGLSLKNPVMTASGTFGYGEEYSIFGDISELGAVVVKGTTLEPRIGNPPPRIYETPAGMLNAIGLQNPGVDAFLSNKLPFLREKHATVVVNIAGHSLAEYIELAGRLDSAKDVSALEINVSCPNVKEGGMQFGIDPQATKQVVREVRKVFSRPLICKLSPNVTDIVEMADAAVEGGADILSLVNTYVGMAVDIYKRKPQIANITAGLSGPAIKPLALHLVWKVAKSCNVPVIGIGGISTAKDALEFFIAGASAVQVGTAQFVNPHAVWEVVEGIRKFLEEQKITDIHEIIGTLSTD